MKNMPSVLLCLSSFSLFAQDDLMKMLDSATAPQGKLHDKVTATFKTTTTYSVTASLGTFTASYGFNPLSSRMDLHILRRINREISEVEYPDDHWKGKENCKIPFLHYTIFDKKLSPCELAQSA